MRRRTSRCIPVTIIIAVILTDRPNSIRWTIASARSRHGTDKDAGIIHNKDHHMAKEGPYEKMGVPFVGGGDVAVAWAQCGRGTSFVVLLCLGRIVGCVGGVGNPLVGSW